MLNERRMLLCGLLWLFAVDAACSSNSGSQATGLNSPTGGNSVGGGADGRAGSGGLANTAGIPGLGHTGGRSVHAGAPSDGGAGAVAGAAGNLTSCLKELTGDLMQYLKEAPYLGVDTMAMPVWETSGVKWQAAKSAALAWSQGDCAAFKGAAELMGYDAVRFADTSTQRTFWVLRDASAQHQGVFAFREPAEAAAARPLVVDSPHWGSDFSDDRAIRLFIEVDAVAFLQNTAHRCSLMACSDCTVSRNYVCPGECPRESDVAHAVKNAYFAVYDGLEEARDFFHFEYHAASMANNIAGCAGSAHISQASTRKLMAAEDDGTYPNLFWNALRQSAGDNCVCYHQRQDGCLLPGSTSTLGRRTNQSNSDATQSVMACTASPPALSGRFIHFEAYGVGVAQVITALRTAVPQP